MEKSISISLGGGSINHNDRKFITKNVDKSRTQNNITLENKSLEEMYHEVFDGIVERYNSRQKRSDRKIDDYLKHVQKSKNGEMPFKEIVVQLGDRFDTHVGSADADVAKEVLKQYAEEFQERNTNLAVFHSVIHMDEETPHLHLDFIPVGCGYKNGMEVRCSFSKAMENMGFKSTGKGNIGGTLWLENERNVLEDIARSHGIERSDKDIHRKHVHISEYKAQMERNEKIIEEMAKTSNLDVREPHKAIRALAHMDENEVIVNKDELNSLVEEKAVLTRQNELQNATIKAHEEKDKNLSEDAEKVSHLLNRFEKYPDYEKLTKDYERQKIDLMDVRGEKNCYEETLAQIHDSVVFASQNYKLGQAEKNLLGGIARRIKEVFARTKTDMPLEKSPKDISHAISNAMYKEQEIQRKAIQRQREMEYSVEKENRREERDDELEL